MASSPRLQGTGSGLIVLGETDIPRTDPGHALG